MSNLKQPVKLSEFIFALSNFYRKEIYKIALDKKCNISQISKQIKLSYGSTLNHIKILEDCGIILRKKETTIKAQESFIESIPFEKDSIYFKIYMELENEKNE